MRISRVATSACLGLLKHLVGHITPGDRAYLAHEIMHNRFHPNTRALNDLFSQGVLAWKNKRYLVEVNGEAALLRHKRLDILVVVRVFGPSNGIAQACRRTGFDLRIARQTTCGLQVDRSHDVRWSEGRRLLCKR